MREIRGICDEFGIMLVLDASLIGENAYFIKMREDEFRDASCADILKTMCGLADPRRRHLHERPGHCQENGASRSPL